MRKIFEDANTSDYIEFMNDGEYIHMFINYEEKIDTNGEFLFTQNQILQMISELSNLLTK